MAAATGFWAAWAKFESKVFGPYLGVEGGVLLRSKWAKNLAEKNPNFARYNNALFVAPLMKWALAVVPLYGVVVGIPKAEDVDINQAGALAFTGAVWTYYATLVVPRADMLVAVNFALFCANGYNVYRKYKWDKDHKPQLENVAT